MLRKRWVISLLFLLLPVAVLADDNERYWGPQWGMMGGGMGPGMMGGGMGPGMMGGGMGPGMMGGGMGMYSMLNLSDAQRSKINQIQDAERRQHWETMGKIMDEQAKLRDLYLADKRDTQAILKVQDRVNQYQRKMLELHLNTENQIEAVLPPEQREQLKSFRRGGYGPGGMGPGNMGRGMMR